MALPSMVVLGPQTPLPSAEYLVQLRSALLGDRRLATFRAAVKDLPNLWPTLVTADPRLKPVPGLQLLEDIKKWIEHGDHASWTSEILPNIISTPLTVMIHIVEYFIYLEHIGPSVSHSKVLESVQSGGIQGFCTGFLAAAALASSTHEEEINEYGAVALRLAVCIGAYVDLDERFANPPGKTSCITVRWLPSIGKSQLLNIIKDYPDVCMV